MLKHKISVFSHEDGDNLVAIVAFATNFFNRRLPHLDQIVEVVTRPKETLADAEKEIRNTDRLQIVAR